MTLTGLGAALGLSGGAIASRVLVSLLFGVFPLDPVMYLGYDSIVGRSLRGRVLYTGLACAAG